jgi:hypothetical protein
MCTLLRLLSVAERVQRLIAQEERGHGPLLSADVRDEVTLTLRLGGRREEREHIKAERMASHHGVLGSSASIINHQSLTPKAPFALA